MDYGRVLSRAWQITWRWKILWVLGFLASLGQGGNANPTYSFSEEELNLERWGWSLSGNQAELIAGVVLTALCVIFILAIVLWVVSIIGRGALIAGVAQVEDKGRTSFRQAWVASWRKFWTLFGLAILSALPLIGLAVVGIGLLALGIAAGVGLLDVQEALGITTITLVTLVCGGLLCCGLILAAIVLEQIRVYAERAAILDDLGWIDAFQRGWQVIRENLGPTLVLWLIFLVIGLLIGAVIFGVTLVLLAPMLVVMATTDGGPWMIAAGLWGGLMMLILVALMRSVATTFVSASWTLTYRELTGQRPAAVAAEAAA